MVEIGVWAYEKKYLWDFTLQKANLIIDTITVSPFGVFSTLDTFATL